MGGNLLSTVYSVDPMPLALSWRDSLEHENVVCLLLGLIRNGTLGGSIVTEDLLPAQLTSKCSIPVLDLFQGEGFSENLRMDRCAGQRVLLWMVRCYVAIRKYACIINTLQPNVEPILSMYRGAREFLLNHVEATELPLDGVIVAIMVSIAGGAGRLCDEIVCHHALDAVDRKWQMCRPWPPSSLVIQMVLS